MPPSPVVRISSGRELRAGNHKRGHSLESGLFYREKEDDLALFNEVQKRERDNFLLQSNDDFDDPFSTKLRYFSDYKLGISVPSRAEGSDLLNAEGDKNDYDWLITPPETPLFPSLDDDGPPVHLAPRGRAKSQPVSNLRSPTGERRGRGSASPHGRSPSPRSSNSTLQSRSRPFSANHSGPPPSMRSPSPSRRLSPPSSKQSPVPRSTTPIPRRLSTGSAGSTDPSRVRGTSPVRASRGNSTSPKIRLSQYNTPGFSSEAPPNLRTSLADRPASYVRGSSPASKNGSTYGRHSMSPTASRNVSASRSHDRDPFSSHIKGSVASSGDYDFDSLQSIPVTSSDRSAPRRSINFSKGPTKILSSSAPKRSFDSDRQMDRKAPRNMFRPLLSSVPSSTFCVGNTSTHHRSLISRNSSVTINSNPNSDQATSRAHGTEESGKKQEDGTSDCVKGCYPDVNEEVFVMDQADRLNEDAENRIMEDSSKSCSPSGVAESSNQLDTTATMHTAIVELDTKRGYSHGDGNPYMVICSKCGLMFHSADVVTEGDEQLCRECNNLDVNSTLTNPLKSRMVGENNIGNFVQILEHRSLEALEQSTSMPKSLPVICLGGKGMKKIADDNQHSYSDSSQNLSTGLIEEGELNFATQQVAKQLMDGNTGYPRLQHTGVNSNSRVDGSEGAAISLLLKRSSSGKGHFVQSRSFSASNTSFDDFSNTRDSVNSMRSSIEHSSASVSSSFDLGSSRQTEIRIHRQSNGQKSDIENYRYEMPMKHKRSISSFSGASSHMFQVPSVAPSCHEGAYPHEQSLASEYIEAESTCTDIESNIILKNTSERLSHSMNVHSGDNSVVSVITSEELVSHENGDGLTNNSGNSTNAETSSADSKTSIQEEGATPRSCSNGGDVAEVPRLSSLDSISKMEMGNVDVIAADSLSVSDSTNSKGCKDKLQQNDVMTATVGEFDFSHPAQEESTILLDDMGGTNARSLTLDEATDAILFCGSIVHNLAYEAANIAIDNESLPMEALRPTVTFVGKPHYERRDMHLRTRGKRSSKSQKARQKKLEAHTKPPPYSNALETDDKSSPQRTVGAPKNSYSMRPPKVESKCDCIIM